MQNGSLSSSDRYNFELPKFKMADDRHFEKRSMAIYLCNRLTDFGEIGTVMQYGPLQRTDR